MGRILRSTLPTTREARKPCLPDRDSLQVKEKEQRRKQKEYFNHHHGVKELPLLEPGDLVWVSDRQETGAGESRLVLAHTTLRLPQVCLDGTEEI